MGQSLNTLKGTESGSMFSFLDSYYRSINQEPSAIDQIADDKIAMSNIVQYFLVSKINNFEKTTRANGS